jgi:hypothetical protein
LFLPFGSRNVILLIFDVNALSFQIELKIFAHYFSLATSLSHQTPLFKLIPRLFAQNDEKLFFDHPRLAHTPLSTNFYSLLSTFALSKKIPLFLIQAKKLLFLKILN